MGHRVAGLVYSCTCSEPERLRLEGSQAGSHAKACMSCWVAKVEKKTRETDAGWAAGPCVHGSPDADGEGVRGQSSQ
jgi:hypothetical protein